ncbi:MAG TPA: endo-1,4-beta-xylanase, partial [Chitinophagaceae bacterium]
MKNKIIIHCIIAGLAAGMFSCKRDVVGILNTGNFSDTAGTLKSAGSNNIGFAVDYGTSTTNQVYFGTVAREANSVTFGNELKYGSVVQNDGSFNYTTADNFYTLCTNAGLQVYGHTLVWYSQQNTNYLAGITGGGGGSSAPNLVLNGGFETAGSG